MAQITCVLVLYGHVSFFENYTFQWLRFMQKRIGWNFANNNIEIEAEVSYKMPNSKYRPNPNPNVNDNPNRKPNPNSYDNALF